MLGYAARYHGRSVGNPPGGGGDVQLGGDRRKELALSDRLVVHQQVGPAGRLLSWLNWGAGDVD